VCAEWARCGTGAVEALRCGRIVPACSTRVTACSRNEKHLRLDAVFKILVDFCIRNSFGVTFVWQPVAFDHHFFLDFIFH
jgi:hypothetical protein